MPPGGVERLGIDRPNAAGHRVYLLRKPVRTAHDPFAQVMKTLGVDHELSHGKDAPIRCQPFGPNQSHPRHGAQRRSEAIDPVIGLGAVSGGAS